jgi:xylulokinase
MSILGIDLGTTGCKAAAYSKDGRCLAQAYRKYGAIHPGPGRSELDSRDVWDKVRQVIREVAAGVGRGAQTGATETATERTTGRHAAGSDPITALCVSSFGEAFVPVTGGREILGPSILNTDVRGAEYADALARDFGQEAFYRINPNILGPQYSLPKLMWTRDHEPELFGRTDFFLFWADFVPFMLGCEPAAANSLANRSLLFDLKKNDWSDELLGWSGIERKKLGRIVAGGTVIGTVDDRAAAELGLPRGVRVVAGGHDQCLNALGAGGIAPGKAVCGIGTFECITPTYGEVRVPMRMLELGLNMEHHVLPRLYVSFLYNQAGSLVKWFRETFAAADVAPEGIDIYAMLDREMPEAPTELLVLPHFDPPQWPEHVADTSGVIAGLKSGTPRGEILKAILECETFYFVDGMAALEKLGIETREFMATGGGARSDAWLQIKADIFGVPFVRPRISEGSMVGAAMLAGIATGVYGSAQEAVDVFVKRERTFEPDARRHAIYKEKLALYRELFPSMRGLLSKLHRAL